MPNILLTVFLKITIVFQQGPERQSLMHSSINWMYAYNWFLRQIWSFLMKRNYYELNWWLLKTIYNNTLLKAHRSTRDLGKLISLSRRNFLQIWLFNVIKKCGLTFSWPFIVLVEYTYFNCFWFAHLGDISSKTESPLFLFLSMQSIIFVYLV